MQEKAVNKVFEMNEGGRRELIIEVTHLMILITGYSNLKYYIRCLCSDLKTDQFMRRQKICKAVIVSCGLYIF